MLAKWEENDKALDEQIDLDIQYVRKQSIVFDIKLLLATIPAVLFARGAY